MSHNLSVTVKDEPFTREVKILWEEHPSYDVEYVEETVEEEDGTETEKHCTIHEH